MRREGLVKLDGFIGKSIDYSPPRRSVLHEDLQVTGATLDLQCAPQRTIA